MWRGSYGRSRVSVGPVPSVFRGHLRCSLASIFAPPATLCLSSELTPLEHIGLSSAPGQQGPLAQPLRRGLWRAGADDSILVNLAQNYVLESRRFL